MQIITCPAWNARQPNAAITACDRSRRIIFHHTAGHHAEISGPGDESLAEAVRYAQAIQHTHMDVNGWIDSGHNFLVTRAGHILQGRWLTVSAIEAGQMVVSAHCPTQNTEIGIEHEHLGTEQMTKVQRDASAWLMAWIAGHYGHSQPLPVYPHRKYFNTACPANLVADIPVIVKQAQALLADAF